MSSIKIRVGASLDANATHVFDPLVKAGARARKIIEDDFKGAAKAQGQVERAAKSTGDKLVADEQRAQQARVKEVERSARQRVSLEKQAMREIEQDLAKHNREVARELEKNERAGSRGGAIGIGRRAAISVSRGTAVAYGLAGRAIASGGGALEGLLSGMGVELGIAPHMANAIDMQQRMADVVNAGYIPGAAGAQGRKANASDVQSEVYAAADKAAFSGNEIAEGLQRFVSLTGDLDTGRKTLKETAMLARATGSDFVSMAEASGEVANHLGNMPNKAAAVSSVMRVIAGQGKMGALEIKDFAVQMAKIAANAPQFDGDISKTIGDLGLIAQEAKMGGGAASASQAATSVLAFASDFSKKTTYKHWLEATDSHGRGLNPFTDMTHTKLRSPEELILEAVKYSHGDQIKLAQLFPSRMAQRAVKPFAAIYSEANGTETEKLKAVSDAFERLRKAQLDATEISRAFSAAMDTNKSQVQLANNKLDELAAALTGGLLPVVSGLAPALEALIPAAQGLMSSFISWMGINPHADDDARKTRTNADMEDALQKELAGATGTAPKLVRGKHGAELQVPDIDRAHVQRALDRRNELTGEVADLERRHKAHLEDYAKPGIGGHEHGLLKITDADMKEGWGQKNVFGTTQDYDQNDQKIVEEARHLAELKIEQNKTNTILSDIRTALTMGQVKLSSTTTPGGTMPAESPMPK